MKTPRSTSVYELVGGTPWFEALIEHFYDAVEADEVLRPLYPDDLTESRSHMVGFLQQYWGGPATYSEERGHPRLRMRHAPFAIGEAERDAWFEHMAAAVRAGDLAADIEAEMIAYFEMATTHMINT